MCSNTSKVHVHIYLQIGNTCSIAWKTHGWFSLQNPNQAFFLLSHSLTLLSVLHLLSAALLSLALSFTLTVSPFSLFLRPLSLTILFQRSLSPAPLFLCRRITINPKCFDFDFLRDSMGLRLCMSMN
ncbi:hypothetical protein QL285_071512 [Trifolium repens]|nr:hypothetical protein QL285_073982 [Trifolium repens]KAK2384137.1 hypothetical protein QL285_071512 [Trifolium repens]